MRKRLSFLASMAAVAASLAFTPPALAENLRVAQQFGITYLQLNVIKHLNLFEKHAAELGVPDLTVDWATFNGVAQMNDALISNSLDVAVAGAPGLITAWSRTAGTPQEIRGICAFAQAPLLMNTNDPALKSIRDLRDTDKIALASVKISIQAIVVSMAAAKEFGIEHYDKLDPLTMSLGPADQTTGLLSGSGGFNVSLSTPPYQNIQLKDPKIRTILDSTDVLGQASVTMLTTTKRFHDEQPVLYKAVLAAMDEATDFISKNRRQAIQFYLDDSKDKISVDDLDQILSDPRYRFDSVPAGTMKFADFMQKTGMIKTAPAAWSDLFFPEIADRKGS